MGMSKREDEDVDDTEKKKKKGEAEIKGTFLNVTLLACLVGDVISQTAVT